MDQATDVSTGGQPNEGGQDTNDLLSKFETVTKELTDTKNQYQNLSKQHEETQSFVKRIQEAIGGKSSEPSQEELDEKQYDRFLSYMVEAERSGKPMPFTSEIAVALMQHKKNSDSQISELKKQVSDLLSLQKQVTDPSYKLDDQAFVSMQTIMDNSLQALYGDIPPNYQRAIAADINEEVMRLKKESPETWDKIRRSPDYQKKMVTHFVTKAVPEKARKMLNEEKLKNEPMTMNELMAAFREAKEKLKDSPKEKDKVLKEIRAKIWELKYGNAKRRA